MAVTLPSRSKPHIALERNETPRIDGIALMFWNKFATYTVDLIALASAMIIAVPFALVMAIPLIGAF